jgi:CO/xanthine dehydrogenase Mo-binding subunit
MAVAATTGLDPENTQGVPYQTYTYASQIAEVEVDVRTGRVRVLRIISAHDVGKAINPGTIEGQIEGGVIMGMGYALMERFDPGRTKNLQQYLIPTSADIPKIIPLIVEHPEKSGPYGAKINHLPLTPERIYDALKAKREN